MTQGKFRFNRLMVTLIFGIRACEAPLPRATETTEKAWPDRVKKPLTPGMKLFFQSMVMFMWILQLEMCQSQGQAQAYLTC